MHRLFLDANVLFSAAYSSSSSLLRFWKLRNVVICSSRYAVAEARANLEQDSQKNRLTRLLRSVELFDASLRPPPAGLSLPEKDIPILLAAIEAQATHLITGDFQHFGRYFGKKIEHILVLSPSAYFKREHLR